MQLWEVGLGGAGGVSEPSASGPLCPSFVEDTAHSRNGKGNSLYC